MRCSSYCTAEEYLLKTNLQKIKKLGYKMEHFENVIHLREENNNKEKRIDIFLFSFGSAIFWGTTEADEIEFLNKLRFLERDPIKEHHSEFIAYDYNVNNKRTYIDEEKNVIYLGDYKAITKLSVSHALAQSVKLYELEAKVTLLLQKTTPIQEELSKTGKVSLSKFEISKQIGMLFSTRYMINMQSDILDTPEFFWRRPSFEPIYLMTVEFQDIQVRQGILNNHLNLIQELFNMLSDEMKHKHSTRIEVIIVLLIAIEVVLAFHKEGFFRYFLDL